jgi:hypothetical protein
MRPYFVLTLVVFLSFAAFAQQPIPRPPHSGGGWYGYGPYVPLVSTPSISFETVSPDPVGASNATAGLIAGATNSTLSELQGPTSASFTVPVWYQGGAPLFSPQVNLLPEPLARKARRLAGRGAMEERGAEREPRQEARAGWLYFSGPEYTADVASAAKGPGAGRHTYGNQDVMRQNEKNGAVHYDGKTEKIQ